jgi:hypothetical protein
MTQAEQYLRNRRESPNPVEYVFNGHRGFNVFADGSVYDEDVVCTYTAEQIIASRTRGDCQPAGEHSDGLDWRLADVVEALTRGTITAAKTVAGQQ